MLYVMRRVALPGTPKHVRGLGHGRLDRTKAWHEEVVAIRATLDTDDELAEIVALMLVPEQTTPTGSNVSGGRISPSDLGRKTKRWASTQTGQHELLTYPAHICRTP